MATRSTCDGISAMTAARRGGKEVKLRLLLPAPGFLSGPVLAAPAPGTVRTAVGLLGELLLPLPPLRQLLPCYDDDTKRGAELTHPEHKWREAVVTVYSTVLCTHSTTQ